MNRGKEFVAMLEELNQPAPGLEDTLNRAYKKKRKRTIKLIVCPLGGLATCLVAFVLLVNLSVPIAYACSQIPVLRELAASVIFSRSLANAVDNDYVQKINLKQTENDITAEIEYLIVDQKQVNIFYRLNSKKYDHLLADPKIRCDDENVAYYVSNNCVVEENGVLLSVTVDFTQGNVPDKLQCVLRVYSYYERLSQGNKDTSYLAEMEFTLQFDPEFTATGEVFPVNKTVILDGQNITVTNIAVYPTHLRVEVAESEDNTAWLKSLDFYIETDGGEKFEPVSNGVTATGSADSPSMVSYRADSPYFYEAEHLKFVITGAQWLRKDQEKTYLNLVTGEHSQFPEGAQLEDIQRQEDAWVIKIRATPGENGEMYRVFGDVIHDSAGNAYTINRWYGVLIHSNKDGSVRCYDTFITLKNYPYDEVWLTPPYSHNWTADQPVEIPVR